MVISYSLPFLSSIPFLLLFSFFLLLHFVHHTRIPITWFQKLLSTHVYPPQSTSSHFFFFPLLPLDSRSSLTLSFSSSLICYSLFFFLFFSTWFHKFSSSLCDTSHINIACLLVSLSSNTHKTRMERKEKSPLLHHNTTAAPPPHYGMHATRGHISFYFFSLFLISCCFWF